MFLNPILLAGIAAAALPIVLHLLGRARVRRRAWGAMLFLQEGTRRQAARSRLRQWLPPALRAAAIVLLAVALARPASGPVDATGRAVVLVVDATASAGYVEAGGARLEQIRQTALSVVGKLSRGDQIGLVVIGLDPAADVPLTTDLQDIASRLAALDVGPRAGDLADGVRRADALLAASGTDTAGARILCVADRQAAAWQPLAVQSRSAAPLLRLAAVGSTRGDNVRVESIRQITLPATANHPVAIDVRLRNDSPLPVSQVPLTIRTGGRRADPSNVDLPAGGGVTVRRFVTPGRKGSVVVTADVIAGGMPADDTRLMAIETFEPIDVRVVCGTSPREADFLRAALTPFAAAGDKRADAFRVRVVTQRDAPLIDHAGAGVLVLLGVHDLADTQHAAVERFVYRGGGLLIAPGIDTTAAAWNRDFWRGGQGVAPAEALSVESSPAAPRSPVAAAPGDAAFDVLVPNDTPGVSITRWLRFAPSPSPPVTLRGGDAWIIARPFGRGRVVAMATSADEKSGDVVGSELFLNAVQVATRHLAAAAHVDRNLDAAAAIEHTFVAPRERHAFVYRPDGRTDRVPLTLRDGAGSITYAAADLPGPYNVRTAGQASIDFVVRDDGRESNLTMLADDAIDALLASSAARRVTPDELARVAGASDVQREYSLAVLAGAMLLLIVERGVVSRADAAAGAA